jgi:hypothetical protein
MTPDPNFVRRLNYILWMSNKGGCEPPQEWQEAYTAGYEQRSHEHAIEESEHPNRTPGDRRIGDEDGLALIALRTFYGDPVDKPLNEIEEHHLFVQMRKGVRAIRAALESLPAATPAVAPASGVGDLRKAAEKARKFLAQSVQFDGGGMDENGNGDPCGYRSEWDQEADDHAKKLDIALSAPSDAQPATVNIYALSDLEHNINNLFTFALAGSDALNSLRHTVRGYFAEYEAAVIPCADCGGSGWLTEHDAAGVPCGDSPCACNPNGDTDRQRAKANAQPAQADALYTKIADAMMVLRMVDENNRLADGERGIKAWNGEFVKREVRRVLGDEKIGQPAQAVMDAPTDVVDDALRAWYGTDKLRSFPHAEREAFKKAVVVFLQSAHVSSSQPPTAAQPAAVPAECVVPPSQGVADMQKWAEGLIVQLPDTHDGRNSWLLNHGLSSEADRQRAEYNARMQAAQNPRRVSAPPESRGEG